jgi:hypothetical protein
MAIPRESVFKPNRPKRDYFGAAEDYIDTRIEEEKSGVLITLDELAEKTGFKAHPDGLTLQNLKKLYEDVGWMVNTTWEYIELS